MSELEEKHATLTIVGIPGTISADTMAVGGAQARAIEALVLNALGIEKNDCLRGISVDDGIHAEGHTGVGVVKLVVVLGHETMGALLQLMQPETLKE